MNQITPTGQMLLISPIARKDEEVNGVILPSVGNADLAEGLVEQVSPYLKDIYKPANKVLYYAKRGVGIIVGGKPHFLINGGNGLEQGDVLAIID